MQIGDLVDVMASGKIESISEWGYLVRVHGELVSFGKEQVTPFSPSISSSDEMILDMLKELARGEAVRYASEIDGDILYACPFCFVTDEGHHDLTCLVIRAQEFLKQKSV